MQHNPLDSATRSALETLYADLDEEIRHAGPVCALSGRCCRFQEYDHTLFLSAIEAARLLADAPPPLRPLDDGATCPWQDDRGRCAARDARPLGCRVYYCDPAYHDEGPRLSELYIHRLKRLSDAAGRAWNYASLHTHLRAARDAGLLAFPATPSPTPTAPGP